MSSQRCSHVSLTKRPNAVLRPGLPAHVISEQGNSSEREMWSVHLSSHPICSQLSWGAVSSAGWCCQGSSSELASLCDTQSLPPNFYHQQVDQTDRMRSRRLQGPIGYHEQVKLRRKGDDNSNEQANKGDISNKFCQGTLYSAVTPTRPCARLERHDGHHCREGLRSTALVKTAT